MNDILSIYCCAAISGRPYDEVIKYYEQLRDDLIKYGMHPFIPMVRKDHMNDPSLPAFGFNEPGSSDKAITNRDRWLVKNSNIVYANLLDAKRVSIGTCMELAWAYDCGKHIILSIEKTGNLHQHAFVLTAADVIYHTHEEAMLYIKEMADNFNNKK